jgi:hypothetical protein
MVCPSQGLPLQDWLIGASPEAVTYYDCAGYMCGDGPGTATFINFDGPDLTCVADGSPRCTTPIFTTSCIAYSGSIGIWFGRDIRDIPDLALKGHLSKLGLSGITHITEDLILMLPAGPADAPALALSIFEDLVYIGGTLTVDTNTGDPASPLMGRHYSLSALQKVSHIGGNLVLRNTRMHDMSIFGALTCVGQAARRDTSAANTSACSSINCHKDGIVVLSGNAELASYNGMQSLTSVTRSFSDVDSTSLMDISAVAQLGHCPDLPQGNTRVRISVAACPGTQAGR